VNVVERHALYVYPGDFERRGLTIGFGNAGPTYLAVAGTADATETQYLIAGARIVWDGEPSITGPGIDRNRRATVNASDLLGTTAASLDLESGALLEVSTYYPNGARENLWTNDADVPLEPMGFTGKEADEETGVTYFGERWLIPRLGRWATPDPLHVHASGGGQSLNSYHYVAGLLLQARDPVGLDFRVNTAPAGVQEGERFVLREDMPNARSSFATEEDFRRFAAGRPVFVYDRSAPNSLGDVLEFIRTMRSMPGATGTQGGTGADGPTPGGLPSFGTGRTETGSGLGTSEEGGDCTQAVCSPVGGGGNSQAQGALDVMAGAAGSTDVLDSGAPQDGGVPSGSDPHAASGPEVQILVAAAALAATAVAALTRRVFRDMRRLAAEAPRPRLESLLRGRPPRQGFSGVFDRATGNLELAPSPNSRDIPLADLPEGWVPRATGHDILSQRLGGDRAGHAGFAIQLQENGNLRVGWRSRQLNPSEGQYFVPEADRARIITAIEEATGRTVEGSILEASIDP
jgi:RHS repeat-associated protein